MEENVNFDNEVLAYLSVRKVPIPVFLGSSQTLFILGPTNRKSQKLHLGSP